MEKGKKKNGKMEFRMRIGFLSQPASMTFIRTKNPENLQEIFGMKQRFLFHRNGRDAI